MTGWIVEHARSGDAVARQPVLPGVPDARRPADAAGDPARAADIGREAGLAHVYVGNAPELDLEDTSCAGCGWRLIERHGYRVRSQLTADGACPRMRTAAGRSRSRSVRGDRATGRAVRIGDAWRRIRLRSPGAAIRPPSVAGSFYPAGLRSLTTLVDELLARADRLAADRAPIQGTVHGLLVPHAGLIYSGVVAAAGWRLLRREPGAPPPTIVVLGTNHVAAALDGVAAWGAGAWRTPLGTVAIDADLADAIVGLGPPFRADRRVHSASTRSRSSCHSSRSSSRKPDRAPHGRRGTWHGRSRPGPAWGTCSPGDGPRANGSCSRSARTWRTTRRRTDSQRVTPSCCRRSWASMRRVWPAPNARSSSAGTPGLVVRDVRHRAGGPRAGGDAGIRRGSRDPAGSRDVRRCRRIRRSDRGLSGGSVHRLTPRRPVTAPASLAGPSRDPGVAIVAWRPRGTGAGSRRAARRRRAARLLANPSFRRLPGLRTGSEWTRHDRAGTVRASLRRRRYGA